jgi:two-component system, sensor histidine kinase and response regulator
VPSTVGERGVVLVVEDNVINQKVARAVVEKLGYQVELAADGVEAVRMVEQGQYVAVLMDLHMPNMDGYEAAIEIRTRLGSAVPIVALTASTLAEDRERCAAVGMDGHLSKPIDVPLLAAALDRAAASSRVDSPPC